MHFKMNYNEFKNLNKHIKKKRLYLLIQKNTIFIFQEKLEFIIKIVNIKPSNKQNKKIVEIKIKIYLKWNQLFMKLKGDSLELISKNLRLI